MNPLDSSLLKQPTGPGEEVATSIGNPPPEAVQFALHRILSSETFASSQRYRDFLQFTITETLAGRGHSLKEYVIGVEVFNQAQSFDPHISPLVRVAASRLRARLKVYYDSEGAEDPILIEYPKGGYVPVFRQRRQSRAEERQNHESFWFRRKWILMGVGFLVLLSALGLSISLVVNRRYQRRESLSRSRIQIYRGAASVAVLPFFNSSAAPETESFSTWLAEELVNASHNVGSLRAVPAETVPSLEGAFPDVKSLGARLAVDNVLQGSIRGTGGRLQVSVQLVAVNSGYHLWSDIYDCRPEDIIVTQHTIARAVVNALRSEPAMVNQKPGAVSLSAYNLYIDGRAQMIQGGDRRLLYARESFERAIAEDPAFGLAYLGLTAVHARLIKWDLVPFNDNLTQAQAVAEKALEMHEHLSEAYAILAVVNSLQWRWKAASQAFAIAIKNDPSSGELWEAYAITYLLPMKRLDQALEGIRKAETLDPLSPSIGVSEGLVHYFQRDYEMAIDECRKALAVQPDLIGAHFGLASALAQQSRSAEAIAGIESLKTPSEDPMVVAYSGYLAGASRASRDARSALVRLDAISEHKPVPSYYKSLIYLGMGNTGQAMRSLEQAYVEREPSLIYLAVDPKWDRLRSHPRFIALLSKIGLPE